MNKNRKKYDILFLAGALLLLGFMGCKKYANPAPVYEELVRTTTLQRKVLVISIDGLTGTELQAVAPANISALQKSSKYSYNVLTSSVATDAGSWASILTGVGYTKHLISQNTFDKDLTAGSGDFEGSITSYRNVFDYITQFKNVKTALVTPWDPLRNYLKNTDFSPVITTDLAVKDSTINILNTQNSLGAMIVNFRDVEAAGANGGYLSTNNNYKDAIVKADAYVGNILTALKARKNYANEDWLVILTTNHGGSSLDPKNGFFIASNPGFKEKELKKTGFNTILFKGTDVIAEVPNDNGLYNAGSTQDFTVQMQVKFNGQTSYPGFLSKSTDVLGTTGTGWVLRQGGNSYLCVVGGSANGGAGTNEFTGGIAADGSWHTIAITVKYGNTSTRTLTTWLDGVAVTTTNISAKGNLSTQEKLTLGYRSVYGVNTALNFQAADLCYFNVALDAATLLANKGLKDMKQHPNYVNLTGYWPIDEGGEGLIANKAPGGYNMVLKGSYKWIAMGTDVPASVAVDPNATDKSIIVANYSIGANILYWMNIKNLASFGIDGDPFLNQFESEFLLN
ncbi:alkaline phosphatase family protein [Pedobacter gandavensis]|uniref:alkaline phosphatase family protein n=1 Tax=Pedobacter gandavensis TaxID=2679963 RepID=UPI00292DAD68|nr:alkaline phosphatase family protein [Pedobacter gandavensis]